HLYSATSKYFFWRGSRSRPVRQHLLELPLAPRQPRTFRTTCAIRTRAAQQGDAPLRRSVTLTEDPPQAMKKRPSHRVPWRFSGECCAKNTQPAATKSALLPTP